MKELVVGSVCLLVGIALVVSTGAIPASTDELRPGVHVYPHPDGSEDAALTGDGELAVSFATEAAGGVNTNARLWADDVFVIAYTGDGGVRVRIREDSPAVDFYTGSYPETTPVTGPVDLRSDESIDVGVFVDTTDARAGERVLDEVTFDVAVDRPSDAAVSADVGRERTVSRPSPPAGPASFRIADVRIDRRNVTTGTPVAFTVSVENVRGSAGDHDVVVSTGDDPLARGSVPVPAGGRVTRTFTHAFESPGTYPIAVNGVAYGHVVVTDAAVVVGGAETPTPVPPTRSRAGIDWLAVTIVLALMVLVALGRTIAGRVR